MKAGGNAKCATFLTQKGVPANTPIKQKYESPAAQLYKEVLRARVEGRPEPTELPKSAKPAGGHEQDPNGMQRLLGETDDQYILRQTRLKEEARQRMAQKFGGSNGMSSSGSRMAGIGSDPNYGNSGGASSMDSFVSGFGSALTMVGSLTATAASSAASVISDPNTTRQLSSLGGSVVSTGSSLWTSFGTTLGSVVGVESGATSDGLSDLQRQMASQRTGNSKYAGFGSDTMNTGGMNNNNMMAGGPVIQECPGMPGEDRNGIERLTGESDEQYVARQTRLRDEAKARMAAKFGNGGLSSAGPSSSSYSPSPSSYSFAQKPTQSTPAPSSSGMQFKSSTTATPPRSAPNSGSFSGVKPVVTKMKVTNSDDFFSSFGS